MKTHAERSQDLKSKGYCFAKKSFVKGSPRYALECYYWRRIVMDEVHELAQAEDSLGGIWPLPCRCINAAGRWGLTGTPNVADLAGVHNLGLLLGVNVGTCDAANSAAFVKEFFSRSQREDPCHPPPIERRVTFKLSDDETALYRQMKFEMRTEIQRGDFKVMEALMQQISHYSLGQMAKGRDPAFALSAEAEIQDLMKRKRTELDKLKEKKTVEDGIISRANDKLRSLDQDSSIQEHLRRSQMLDARGRKEEAVDRAKAIQIKLDKLQKEINYFNNTVSELKEGKISMECCLCLQTMLPGDAVIAICGHSNCSTCMELLFNHPPVRCPTCRIDLDRTMCKRLQVEQIEHLDLSESCIGSAVVDNAVISAPIPCITEPNRNYSSFGTKISFIATQIATILEVSPNAKILVYTQWDALKRKLVAALKQFKMPCSTLEGRPEQLNSVLRSFEAPNTVKDSTSILICSLELKAAGLNLQMANHVMVC